MFDNNSILTVHNLLCHKHVDIAITCLSSLLRFSINPIRLVIHDDGSLTPEDVERLFTNLNNPKIILRNEADELMNQLLENHPNAKSYRHEHVFGMKLLDIAMLGQGDIAYCDSDVLFFQPFVGMFQWTDSITQAIFMVDYQDSYSIPWYILWKSGIKLPSRTNAGLLFLRREAYDLDFIEWFLSNKEFSNHDRNWLEQTCWAALGYRSGCRFWHPNQVAMQIGQEISSELVATHFVSPTRHLLSKLIPRMSSSTCLNQPVIIETIEPQECNVFHLAQLQIKRQYGRFRRSFKAGIGMRTLI